MKVLITGVAGFIGSHLAKKLISQGYEVVGIDNINDYYSIQLKEDRLKSIGKDNFHFDFALLLIFLKLLLLFYPLYIFSRNWHGLLCNTNKTWKFAAHSDYRFFLSFSR